MRLSRRSMLSLAVFLGVGALIFAGWALESRHSGSRQLSSTVTVNVTSGADRGPGTLREALFMIATAPGQVRVSLDVPKITISSPLPPIVNSHGVHIVARQAGSEIDASGLPRGPVLDIAAANVSLDGLAIRNCRDAAILVRAVHVSLQSTTVMSCDVGVDVAGNSRDLLIEHNRFMDDRIGVRFSDSSPDTTVAANRFSGERQAGVWAVRGTSGLRAGTISVRDNRFDQDYSGIVAGNIDILIEQNQIAGAHSSAIDLVGAGAIVRGNRVSGGAGMGILADGAHAAVIEHNDINGLAAYGIMVRDSSNTLVRANRLYDCAYGMAFVLGDTRDPSTVVDNIVIEPRYDGIDVIGDAPILRRNHVLQPHAFALRVEDFEGPDGHKIVSAPFLDHNSFGPSSATVAARQGGSWWR